MRRLAPLIVVAVVVPGCYKFSEEFVVLPNGSGKMQLEFALKQDDEGPKKVEGGREEGQIAYTAEPRRLTYIVVRLAVS